MPEANRKHPAPKPVPALKKGSLDNIINRGLERGGSLYRHGQRGGPRRRRSWGRIVGLIAVILVALALAGGVSLAILFAWMAKDLPDPNNIRFRTLPQTTKIYDRTGETVLYEVHGDEKRTIVELTDISPYVLKATVTAEDKDFYKHKGFSIRGFVRAMVKNIMHGTLHGEGGSTITQQFIKNSVLTKDKTYTRKIKELVLSTEMERRYSKDEILKLYLNEIPYGSVIYGIESAAQSYFGKPAKDLTLSESAVLASIPKATSYYSPFGSHRQELLQRAHYIIDSMEGLGEITAEEAKAAKEDDVLARIKPKMDNIVAPHFVFYVREQLADQFGDQAESGGLKVITTLDTERQQMAEEAINEGLDNVKDWGGSTAAMMALNPRNGEVLSMVGSPDYFDDEHNGQFNSIFGFLQPGSSIKPIVYAAGFEKGYTPDTILDDVETVFATSPKEYKPSDYDGKERGPITVRQALAGSLNIPAVEMLYLVGLKQFSDLAQKLGYTSFNDPGRIGLSLVLGGGEVYPYEHISAYSVFPEDGYYRPPKVILKVEDAAGKVITDNTSPAPAKKVMSEQTARQITSILSDNAARAYIFGEKNLLTLPDRPVAAKTGTTNKFKDAWTIGFTPSLLAGVWVGNHDGSAMKAGADSSKVAAPIWNSFMKKALAGRPVESFTPPEPVVTGKPILDGQAPTAMKYKIDKMSGKLATESTPADMIEEIEFSAPHSILYFVNKDDPRGPDPTDPASDPQYRPWEDAIAAWAAKQEITLRPPPTEKDDLHTPENIPSVTLQAPLDGVSWPTRQVSLAVNASAKRGVYRVEYRIDGEEFASFESFPFGGMAAVPNRINKGFHRVTAVAFDDVGNRAESNAATINLTADSGPLGLAWIAPPQPGTTLYPYQFPYQVKIRLDDYKSVQKISLTAIKPGGWGEEVIGTINNPPLPNISFTWQKPDDAGSYTLRAEAEMEGGTNRTQEMSVTISR